jgi:hypothetical protein
MSGAMRDRMPECAAFIDALREAFGAEEINNVIKRGLRPDCKPEHRVYFREGDAVLGQPMLEPANVVTAADMVIGPVFSIKKRGRG